MNSVRMMTFTAVVLLITSAAYAFEPLPLNRAYPITGPDLVSGQTVSLEDHAGKWVFLEYWASW